MPKERVLITVKTYPTLSTTYHELVCTAGLRENGTWVRIYPVPFRQLSFESQYKKYDWIELDLVKSARDFRPESHRPANPEDIKVVGHLKSDRGSWAERRAICLQKVYTNLTKLIDEAKDRSIRTSLAVFKPTKIIDFTYEECDQEWDSKKVANLKATAAQGDLFASSEIDNIFRVVRKLPYKFKYKFEDESGKQSEMMIEDWEIGALYWNCLKERNNVESLAVLDVKMKYFDSFLKEKDLYFFLGTTLKFHIMNSHNPFIIIGTFHPKPISQTSLF